MVGYFGLSTVQGLGFRVPVLNLMALRNDYGNKYILYLGSTFPNSLYHEPVS